MKRWVVTLTREARVQLLAITDRRIQESIRECINSLEYEPDMRGKPMRDELIGHRSIRAIGQRYRVIYKVDGEKVTVLVVTVGMRKDGDKKDAYELAKRLMGQGLLDLE